MGDISPIGDRSSARVQPINWTEKANLNQRRTGNPSLNQRSEVVAPPEDVPQLDIYDGETPLSSSRQTGRTPYRMPEETKTGTPRTAGTKTVDGKPAEPKSVAPKSAELKSAAPESAAPTSIEPRTAEPNVAPAKPELKPTLQEASLADLQAKRTALINAGTADSITELGFVNEELAKRGQFRSALEPGVRQGSPAALSAPESAVSSPKSAAVSAPESALPGATVKLSPEQLPPAVRDLNLHTEDVNSSFLKQFASPLGKVVSYGFGTLGVVGGLFQLSAGIDEMRAGNYGEGSVTSLAGICNTTAGGATFFANMPFASALATRAGGVGAMLDGGLQLYKGYTTGNDVQLLDGGVKTTLGGTMMSGGPVGWCAGSAYAGWSAGRFLGGLKVSGESTVDDVVTQGIYNLFYA